jgi:hypothetical protein
MGVVLEVEGLEGRGVVGVEVGMGHLLFWLGLLLGGEEASSCMGGMLGVEGLEGRGVVGVGVGLRGVLCVDDSEREVEALVGVVMRGGVGGGGLAGVE